MKLGVILKEDESSTCLTAYWKRTYLGHVCRHDDGMWHVGYGWGDHHAIFPSLMEVKKFLRYRHRRIIESNR